MNLGQSDTQPLVNKLTMLIGGRLTPVIGLIVAMAVGALLEALGVGIVIPFIGLLANPHVDALPAVARRILPAGMTSPAHLIIGTGVLLFTLNLIKNAYLYALYEWQFRFVMQRQSNLACRLFSAHMRNDYSNHLQRNSSESIRSINTDVFLVFTYVLVPILTILSELLVILALFGLLLSAAPMPALLSVVFLSGVAIAAALAVRGRVKSVGELQRLHLGRMIRWVQQGLGAFKEAKVLHCEEFFITEFAASSQDYADAARRLQVAGQSSRLAVETLCFAGLAVVVSTLLGGGATAKSILPTLALFAAAAIRLMPSMNRILFSATAVQSHLIHVDRIFEDLERCAMADHRSQSRSRVASARRFVHSVDLVGIGFKYRNAKSRALDGLSLRIPKGASVAFVGPSGGGKSTAVDLLLGLLTAQQGAVLADGEDIHQDLPGWQAKIAHIPQPVYLFDDSIRRNIAFGISSAEIDDRRIWETLRLAHLEEFVRGLPRQLDTLVGERGSHLSGGQRQRIGIARVLYRDPEVLILDEATSALDNETEAEIVETFKGLSGRKTVIVVAHRLATVKDCDLLYFFQHGRVIASGTFEQLLTSCPEFRRLAEAGTH